MSVARTIPARPLAWLSSWLHLERLRYEDFPGTYFEIHRTAASSNDTLCDNRLDGWSAAERWLRRLAPNDLIEIALRKSMMDQYTVDRVKTAVLVRELQAAGHEVVLVPRDNLPADRWLPEGPGDAWLRATIPRWCTMFNALAARLQGIGQALFAVMAIVVLIAQRGIALRVTRQTWRVGYDLYDEGMNWHRPYHESFLYDDGELQPSRVLHVIRDRLKDDRTRECFHRERIPFVESGTVKIPLRHALGRLPRVVAVAVASSCASALHGHPAAVQWAAVSVLIQLVRCEIFMASYRILLFVARDEYSLLHIVRTLLFEGEGGRTVGFGHGDDPLVTPANTYQTMSHFCFPSQAHRELLERNTRFSRRTSVIGAGIYGLDETYKAIALGQMPERYASLRGRYRLIGFFPTSYAADFFMTRELTLRFYRQAAELAGRRTDVVCVIRPKDDEPLDAEFQAIVQQGGDRLIVASEWSYRLLPALEIMVCIATSSIGLEGLMTGRRVVYFDESGFAEHPYERWDPFLVARTPEALRWRLDRMLDDDMYVSADVIAALCAHRGGAFDGRVVERFRNVIYSELQGAALSPGASVGPATARPAR